MRQWRKKRKIGENSGDVETVETPNERVPFSPDFGHVKLQDVGIDADRR